MKRALERLMKLLRKKYPQNNYNGMVKIAIYSDESGEIRVPGHTLYSFDSIPELVGHLLGGEE